MFIILIHVLMLHIRYCDNVIKVIRIKVKCFRKMIIEMRSRVRRTYVALLTKRPQTNTKLYSIQ